MGNMASSLPNPAESQPSSGNSVGCADTKFERTQPATTNTVTKSTDEEMKTQTPVEEQSTRKCIAPKQTKPLRLFDLPLDILEDIVKEVRTQMMGLHH